MLFVPRQVLLGSPAAAAAMAKEEVKREKEEKKSKRKSKSSSSAESGAASDPIPPPPHAPESVRGGKEAAKGKGLIFHSIAAFLEASGFSRALAALQSEASLEAGVWKSSSVSLEDLFGKFLESSDYPAQGSIDGSKEQGKSTIDVSGETHKKKKKKKKDHPEINETEKQARVPSTMNDPGENGHTATVSQNEIKEKKRKKKSSSLAGDTENDQTNENANTGENSEENKKKKSKKQKRDDITSNEFNAKDAAVKLEKTKLLPQNSYKVAERLEEDNKEQVEEIENHRESQSHKSMAENNGLGAIAPQDKGRKRKKAKSTSEKPSSEKTDAATSAVEAVGNSDSTKSDAAGTGIDDTDKKRKKKRKKSDSEENALEEGKEMASKDGVVKSDRENKEGMEILKDDDAKPDGGNIVGKKRKLEEIEGSTRPAEDLLGADQSNKTADQKLGNGLAEDDTKERSTISKPSKRQKHSSEPNTVNVFQRVKLEQVKFANERLQDNSYWAKDGADSGYGAKAQEVLGQVRGRDFRHEKTKKKRGSYRGGEIDLQTHSIKFSYSDDE